MDKIIRYWLGEAVVGCLVTWALAYVGDGAAFTGLAVCGGCMGITVLALGTRLGLTAVVLVFAVGIALPFAGASAFEGARDKPVSAIVRGKTGHGTTWSRFGAPVVRDTIAPLIDEVVALIGETIDKPTEVRVTAERIRVRRTPSTRSPVTGELDQGRHHVRCRAWGAAAEIRGSRSNWWVRIDEGDIHGWVSALGIKRGEAAEAGDVTGIPDCPADLRADGARR